MPKVLVSIEEHLLKRVDREAKRLGVSRSAYLARLAREAMEGARGPGARPEVGGALRSIDRLVARNQGEDDDATAVVRAMRDSR